MNSPPSPLLERLLRSERETCALAARLALRLEAGDCLAFEGGLGAGKTAFVRALVQALSSAPQEVVSPTFLLAQQYDVALPGGASARLWHYDLYRLKSESELDELALEEALAEGVVCIEWPALAAARLPEGRLEIRLDCGDKEGERRIAFHGNGKWRARLAGWGEDPHADE